MSLEKVLEEIESLVTTTNAYSNNETFVQVLNEVNSWRPLCNQPINVQNSFKQWENVKKIIEKYESDKLAETKVLNILNTIKTARQAQIKRIQTAIQPNKFLKPEPALFWETSFGEVAEVSSTELSKAYNSKFKPQWVSKDDFFVWKFGNIVSIHNFNQFVECCGFPFRFCETEGCNCLNFKKDLFRKTKCSKCNHDNHKDFEKVSQIKARIGKVITSLKNCFEKSPTKNSKSGFNRLHEAVIANDIIEVRSLIDLHPGIVNLPTSEGFSCLTLALLVHGNNQMFKQLLTIQTDPNEALETSSDVGALFQAASQGNSEAIELLVKCGGDVKKTKNSEGETVLHFLVSNHHSAADVAKVMEIPQVKTLLEERDNEGQTPLLKGAAVGNEEAYSKLKQEGADRDVRDNNGNTVMHLSAQSNSTNILKEEIKRVGKVDIPNKNEQTPLHAAAISGAMAATKELLTNNADKDCQDKSGKTPLYHACENETEVVQFLVKQGADCSISDEHGNTPGHAAAARNNPQLIQTLAESPTFDETAQNVEGKTPVHVAAEKGSVDVIKVLNDTETPDFQGRTPVMTAIQAGQNQAFEELKDKGASLDVTDYEGNTTIHVAAASGNKDVIPSLIEFVDPNTQNFQGKTALHLVVTPEVTVELIKSGVRVDFKDENGQYAIHSVVNNPAIVKELVQVHPQVANQVDGSGNTALHISLKQDNEQSAQVLMPETNLTIKNEEKLTPLHILIQKPRQEETEKKIFENPTVVEAVQTPYPDGKLVLTQVLTNKSLDLVTKIITIDESQVNQVDPTTNQVAIEQALKIPSQHPGVVSQIALASNAESLNRPDTRGESPITRLIENPEQVQTVKTVIKDGKLDPKHKSKRGRTYLFWAAYYGNTEAVMEMLLVDNLPDFVNEQDKVGWSALHAASSQGHLEVIQVLLDNKANIDLTALNGSTPLFCAAASGHVEAVKYLLAHGAKPQVETGWTALQIAIWNGNSETTTLMLDYVGRGVNINYVNPKNGFAAIHCFIASRKWNDLSLLFTKSKQFDINIKTKKSQRTPLNLAIHFGNLSIVEQLVKAGADMSIQDSFKNFTPLQKAVAHGHLDIAEFLAKQLRCPVPAVTVEPAPTRTALLPAVPPHPDEVNRDTISPLIQGKSFRDCLSMLKIYLDKGFLDAAEVLQDEMQSNNQRTQPESDQFEILRALNHQLSGNPEEARTGFQNVLQRYPVGKDDDIRLQVLIYLRDLEMEETKDAIYYEQQIEKLEKASILRDFCFVVDTSGSMSGARIHAAEHGLKLIIDTIDPEERFAIVEFNSKPKVSYSMTPKHKSSTPQQFSTGGGTAFYDAVAMGIDLLQGSQSSSSTPKWLIALTDGEDTSSKKYAYYSLLAALQNTFSLSNFFIIAVEMESQIEEQLKKLCDAKNGMLVPARDTNQIAQAFQTIQGMMKEETSENLVFDVSPSTFVLLQQNHVFDANQRCKSSLLHKSYHDKYHHLCEDFVIIQKLAAEKSKEAMIDELKPVLAPHQDYYDIEKWVLRSWTHPKHPNPQVSKIRLIHKPTEFVEYEMFLKNNIGQELLQFQQTTADNFTANIAQRFSLFSDKCLQQDLNNKKGKFCLLLCRVACGKLVNRWAGVDVSAEQQYCSHEFLTVQNDHKPELLITNPTAVLPVYYIEIQSK